MPAKRKRAVNGVAATRAKGRQAAKAQKPHDDEAEQVSIDREIHEISDDDDSNNNNNSSNHVTNTRRDAHSPPLQSIEKGSDRPNGRSGSTTTPAEMLVRSTDRVLLKNGTNTSQHISQDLMTLTDKYSQTLIDSGQMERDIFELEAIRIEYEEMCNRYDYLKSLRETEAERLLNEYKAQVEESTTVSSKLIDAQKNRINVLLQEQEDRGRLVEQLQQAKAQQDTLLHEINNLRLENEELARSVVTTQSEQPMTIASTTVTPDTYQSAIITMYQQLTGLSLTVESILPNGDANVICCQQAGRNGSLYFALSHTNELAEGAEESQETVDPTQSADKSGYTKTLASTEILPDTMLHALQCEVLPPLETNSPSIDTTSLPDWLQDAMVFDKSTSSLFYWSMLKVLHGVSG